MRACIFVLFSILLFGCAAEVSEEPQEEVPSLPEAIVCEDSDGIDGFTAGTVKIGEAEYYDGCDDGRTVREYSCDGDSLVITQVSCGEGYVCDSGRCVEEPPEPPSNVTEEDCIETDSGKDYEVYGSVNHGGQLYHDICQGNYDLLEYYCKEGELGQTVHHCNPGEECHDGACVGLEKACADSDEANPALRGTTTQYGGGVVISTMQDQCIDEWSKTEYYCEGGVMKDKAEECKGGTYCSDGVCMEPCVDEDSGQDYSKAASAIDTGGVYSDYCSDEDTLVEYYCSDDELLSAIHDCDTYCHEGHCVKGSGLSCQETGMHTRIMYEGDILVEENDTCLAHDVARDYFCLSDGIEWVNVPCDEDELCYDGGCVKITEEACYDLDADLDDIHIRSLVVLTTNVSVKGTKEDECIGEDTLIEYRCDGKYHKADHETCPGDEMCVEGRCIYPYSCTETDGGQSIEPGEASLWDDGTLLRTEQDGCTGDGKVFEIFCTDEGLGYSVLECPAGTVCDPETRACG